MTIVSGMALLGFEMPPHLERWVSSRLSDGRYVDAADYVRDLIRRDQEAMEEDVWRVRALIQEGLDSGICEQSVDEIMAEMIAGIPAEDE